MSLSPTIERSHPLPKGGPRATHVLRRRMLLALVFLPLLFALLLVFYGSPLREQVENRLYDLRTLISPYSPQKMVPLVVQVDQGTLDRLGIRDLTYGHLVTLTERLIEGQAKTVTLLLHPQVFAYDDPALSALVDLASLHPERVRLGVFDLVRKEQFAARIPPLLLPVRSQLVDAGLARSHRRSVVRRVQIPVKQEIPLLAVRLASSLRGDGKPSDGALDEQSTAAPLGGAMQGPLRSIKINYPRWDDLPRRSAADLLIGEGGGGPRGIQGLDNIEDIEGRDVLVGYTLYRPATETAFEATFINTPWQQEGQDVNVGTPLVDLQAAISANLAAQEWLTPLPLFYNVIQTVVVSGLALGVWTMSAGVASAFFILGWLGLLALHAMVYAYFHLDLPLADTALFSLMGMLGGAFLRIRIDGRHRAEAEARALAEKSVAQVQERFLSRFAVQLGEINQAIRQRLAIGHPEEQLTPTGLEAYQRALQSSEELSDYLQGIQHFAGVQAAGVAKPKLLFPVAIRPIVEQTLRQFDARQADARITVAVEVPSEAAALGDATLIAQILYNLLSNALKYSPPETTVRLTFEGEGREARIRVSDQGAGIAPEHLKLIFEKFYRIQNDLSFQVKGHGLGLYLSQYFARLMQGHITVASRVGEGSTFTLTLRRQ